MIYTLTTNPAVDVNSFSATSEVDIINRTEGLGISPNGKGLNVSFALKKLGVDSGIIGFFGGFTGKYIADYCKDNGFRTEDIGIEGVTRINYFVNTPGGEIRYVNKGPVVSEECFDTLIRRLGELDDLTLLSINGSAANGQPEDYYDRIFRLCGKRGIPVVFDVDTPKAADILKYRPLLIKPNDEELKKNFGYTAETEEQIVDALEKLTASGAGNVLLTLGTRGSYFTDGKRIIYCSAKKVETKSSVCCGDSCLAGFLSVFLSGGSPEDALRRGAACGADTAESYGLGELKNYKRYEKEIEVRMIKEVRYADR